MELISIAAQTRLFFLSCGTGFLLGILYDVFRLLRQIKKNGKIWVFVCDFIYCVFCTFFSFSFILAANKGQVRWYILFGEFAGWLIYVTAIADITGAAAKRLAAGAKKLFSVFHRIIMLPLRPIRALFRRIHGKFVGITKKERKSSTIKSKKILKRKGKT